MAPLECPPNVASGLPESKEPKENIEQYHNDYSALAFGVTLVIFKIPLSYMSGSYPV